MIAGVDEVGRGALAGPVVAAAVSFGREVLKNRSSIFKGEIKDSKLLSARKREELFFKISKFAKVATYSISHQKIDEVNILEATKLAMKEAILSLSLKPDLVLIDGNITLDLKLAQVPIPGGDRVCFSISAASIIAKVTRDRYMVEMDNKYGNYNFVQNKGYGTKEHMELLRLHGPSPIHRKTFAPLKNRAFKV
ncbi:MAG: ribonuclease HII [Candidatus Kaelpia imicola]|nr:ribonuclease HII [Candidatus Kaelpia imicola]